MKELKCQTGEMYREEAGRVCTKCRKPILGLNSDGCWCDLEDGERSAPVWIETRVSWIPRKENND